MKVTPKIIELQWEAVKAVINNPTILRDDETIASSIDAVSNTPELWNYIQLCGRQPIGIFTAGMVLGIKIQEAHQMEKELAR